MESAASWGFAKTVLGERDPAINAVDSRIAGSSFFFFIFIPPIRIGIYYRGEKL